MKQVLVDVFLQYKSEQSYRSLAQMNERIYKLLEKADNILFMDLSFDLVCRMRDIVNRIVLLVFKRSEHKVFNLIAEMDVLNSELDNVIEIKSLQKSVLAYINEIPPVLRPEERKDFTIRDAGVNSLLKIDGGHFVVRDRYCTGKIYHDDLPETEWCQLKIRHIEKEGKEYYIKFNQIGPLRMFITDPTFHSTQINIKSEKELKQILHQRKKLKVDGTEYALTENFLEHLYKVNHEKLFRNYQFMHGDKILCIEKWHGEYKLVAGRCLRVEDVVIMAIGGGLYCAV